MHEAFAGALDGRLIGEKRMIKDCVIMLLTPSRALSATLLEPMKL